MEEDDNAASKKELAMLNSQLFKRPSAPHHSILRRRKEEREEEEKKMKTWIRNEPDADGYFLLQLEKKIEHNDMFLTADDAASLTIASK